MKKLILFVLCALSGLMVSAQSRWGITPEGGFAAVNRVGMGSSWRAGVKVGVGVSYQFEPGWIGLKSGLYYANRGYSLGDYPRTTESATYVLKEMMTGGITQHFLQLDVYKRQGLSILKNPCKRTYKDFWICAAEGTRTPTP